MGDFFINRLILIFFCGIYSCNATRPPNLPIPSNADFVLEPVVFGEDYQATKEYPYSPAAYPENSSMQKPVTPTWIDIVTRRENVSHNVEWQNWKGVGRTVFGAVGFYHGLMAHFYLNQKPSEYASKKDIILAACHCLPFAINLFYELRLVAKSSDVVANDIEAYVGLIELPIYVGWGLYKLYNKVQEVERKKLKNQYKPESEKQKAKNKIEKMKKDLKKLQEIVDKLD